MLHLMPGLPQTPRTPTPPWQHSSGPSTHRSRNDGIRALDKQEREERIKRAEAKRRDEEARRRAELEEKARHKDERLAARQKQLAAVANARPGIGAFGKVRLRSRLRPGLTRRTAAGLCFPTCVS